MPKVRRATRDLQDKLMRKLKKSRANKPTSKSKSKPKPPPLVERTNALSLEEFTVLHVPPSELSFQKTRRKTAPAKNSNPTPKAQPNADAPQIQELAGTRPTKDEDENDAQEGPSSELEIDTYDLSIYTAATIPTSELSSCFKLIELTSSAAYKSSSMGWSPVEKRKEMKLPDMKYMILRQRAPAVEEDKGSVSEGNEDPERERPSPTGEFAGFLEFMVTYEDGYEVLYCYEIHLTPEAQGQGLGEALLERFERIGQRIGLEKAMLTVFKSNSRAIKFYTRAGFEEDENSPRPRKLRNGTVKEADYMIMSKSLR
ncbi:acyl-CoA N-acyltransferase [Aspergillus multicolor]|uniref:N-terminal L-serine N(alpha)-acetyltransferase NAT4 n=1 Tax=Aspergillus multicolor TaxID=41759 RepID=UPI003CCCBFF3